MNIGEEGEAQWRSVRDPSLRLKNGCAQDDAGLAGGGEIKPLRAGESLPKHGCAAVQWLSILAATGNAFATS
jgi:hypothetical protein